MSADRNCDTNKKTAKNLWGRIFLWLLMLALLLYIGGIICLIAAHFMQFGINDKSIKVISIFLFKLKQEPWFLFEAYDKWLRVFLLSFRYGQLNAVLLVPILAPLSALALIVATFLKSPYSFKLWYRLNNRFAKAKDIEKMGLFSGSLAALGCFQKRTLHLDLPLSVFGWGSPGLGKTSTVAIPSILESDKACIIAADCKGSLAKYTSGYRAKLGKVFCFNWNMLDKPESGQFWPRWNPFSQGNMPPKGNLRDHYLAGIAKSILSIQEDNYWAKLGSLALEGLMQFYVSKIEQAYANDYILGELLDHGRLSSEDKDVLLSFYALMPEEYSKPAIESLENNTLTIDNYLPIGSWQNIPPAWQGKEFCFAMLVDCLVERYYNLLQEERGREYGRWKAMLDSFIKETEFFGYHPRANQVLQHLFYLTKKQRKMIFAVMLEPLMVFRKESVRERTSVSDLFFDEIRGGQNIEDKEWQVSTIYTIADNRPAAFMTRFFTDMLIKNDLEHYQQSSPFPLLFVLDDFELLPKFNMLQSALVYGPSYQMSFLLLTDNLANVQSNYGREGLEEIISNTSYKLMFADNNQNLSENFSKLAVFGTKAVQIPATDTGAFFKVGQKLTDASYYQRIAEDLLDKHRQGVVKKGQHLLLVQGYYHLPVKIDSLFFLKDENLKAKALIEAAYFPEAEVIEQRDAQDAEVPSLLSVLQEAGIDVAREEDVDAYLNDQIDVIAEDVKRSPKDKQAALAEDLSVRWSRETESSSEKEQDGKEWWLSEESFSVSGDVNKNPFEKH